MEVLGAIEWSQGVENAWTDIAEFVPKLIGFLAILVIGYFVAKALAKVVDKVLERAGFDKAVERGGIRKALSKSQYDASDVLAKVVYYGLMLLVLQMAFGVFGPNPVSVVIDGVISYLPKVFAAIVIIVVMSAIAAAAREAIDATLGGLSYGKALANVAGLTIAAVGVFAALNQLNIAPAIVNGLFYATLAIIAGSAIIAIGGGGVRPMQAVWERSLNKVGEEAPNIRQQAEGANERMKQRAQERAQQAQEQAQQSGRPVDVREREAAEAKATTNSWSSGGTGPGATRNPQGF